MANRQPRQPTQSWAGGVFHPDYSTAASPEEAWRIYEGAVQQHLDPHYTYNGTPYSPIANRSHLDIMGALQHQFAKTPQGQQFVKKLNDRLTLGGAIGPTDVTKFKKAEALGKQVQKQLSGMEKQGISENNAIYSLYNRLHAGKNPNLKKETLGTPEAQKFLVQQSPQFQYQTYLNQQVMPTLQGRATNLFDAADVLEKYEHASTKQKAALLANLGYTSEADIYRGLSAYLPKDVPITPETLREAAGNIQSPLGVSDYEIKDLLKTAADRGKQQNLMAQLIATTGAKGVDPKNVDIASLWQLINAGGATGVKKSAGSGVNFKDPFKGLNG